MKFVKTFLETKVLKAFRNYSYIMGVIWESAPAYLIFLLMLTIAESLLPLGPMFLLKEVLNTIAAPYKGTGDVARVFYLIGGIALVSLLLQFINSIKSLVSSLTLNVVGRKISYIIQRKAAELDLKFYDTAEYYQKLDNARRVMGRRWDMLLNAPIDILGSIITLVSMIALLAAFNYWLVPIIIIALVPNIFVQLKTRFKEVQFFSDQISENRKINYTENILSDRAFAKEVRIFNLNDYLIEMSQKFFRKQFEKLKKLKTWQIKKIMTWSFLSNVVLLGCELQIAYNAVLGHLTIGEWQLYSSTLKNIETGIVKIFSILAVSYEEDLYADILMELMNTKPDIDMEQGKAYPTLKNPPRIEFKNVSFTYPNTKTKLLKDISFVIHPGEKIALVGLNGSGKSTMIKLLTRLYDPNEGEIIFDHTNVKRYKPSDIYRLFGVVFQDFSRFAFTAAENIGISDLSKMQDMESIKKAAEASGTNELIEKLPKSYNTYLTKFFDVDGCSDLSGGEWQKIAIARAFFRDAPVVILDEPTAALDPQAEYEIYKQFLSLCNNKSAILISHRLSSVRMVDRIFFIKDGMIVEAGTHHELMALEGEYYRLFTMQATQYDI